MSDFTRLHALCLALTISLLVGCADFQAQSRAGSAKEYNELGLWINNTNELAKLPAPPKPDDGWLSLFNGKDLSGWEETDYAGRGNVKVQNGELHIENGLVITGVTYTNKTVLPKTNYEIEYEAKKLNGTDFFGLLTFPVGDAHASLVTGGWGGAVTGISSINSMDASENNTTVYLKFNKDHWYKFRLRVTPDNLSVWMTPKEHLIPLNATVASVVKSYQEDAAKAGQTLTAEQAEAALRAINPKLDENIPARDTIYFPGEAQIINETIKDKVVNMRVGEIELSAPLGFATFQTYGVLRNIRMRRIK
ncbi:MAG: hypothetical protein CMO67_05540 [Verrucomicrobiales bacterium]|nr:hypothetical protein [Verrucomicrobiales bacterium]